MELKHKELTLEQAKQLLRDGETIKTVRGEACKIVDWPREAIIARFKTNGVFLSGGGARAAGYGICSPEIDDKDNYLYIQTITKLEELKDGKQ